VSTKAGRKLSMRQPSIGFHSAYSAGSGSSSVPKL
jgi:hypothetical protein